MFADVPFESRFVWLGAAVFDAGKCSASTDYNPSTQHKTLEVSV